jgi:hypothetical protein
MGRNQVIGIDGTVLGGVTSGLYRNPPWHGVGDILDSKGAQIGFKRQLETDPRTSQEILALAGIDWNVDACKLNELLVEPLVGGDEKLVLVRPDTKRLLGIHSDGYGVLQNSVGGGFVEEILNHRQDATLRSVTELYGGQILFAVIEFRDEVRVTRGDGTQLDKHTRFMGVYWSHNGQYPLGVKYMHHEWVCENTFTPWNAETGLTIRHTVNAEDIAQDARMSLERMMTAMDEFDHELEGLLQVEADRRFLTQGVIPAVIGKFPKEEKEQRAWDKKFNAIVAEWDEYTTQASGFDAVMAVQGWEQHRKRVNLQRDVSNIRRLIRDDYPMTVKAVAAVKELATA